MVDATNKAPAKSKRGGKRPGAGRKPGYQHDPRTIEKIRASINSKLCIDTLHDLCENGGQHDSVRATAAKILLDRVVPVLTSTDITSGGEAITVERVSFKRDGK
jgi:hypothetical protein